MQKYTGLLSQTLENDPTETVLENTIGEIVWTRDVRGSYYGTRAGAFPADKTVVFFGAAETAQPYNGIYVTAFRLNDDIIAIVSQGHLDTGYDDMLRNTPIEIRVYNT